MSDPYLDNLAAGWRERFKNHTAVLARISDEVTLLHWAKLGTKVNHIVYVIITNGGVLHIHGDLDFASHCWYRRGLDIPFLAGCGFDYFMEKCQSSEKGRRPRGWDHKEGAKLLRNYWQDWELSRRVRHTNLDEALESLRESANQAGWEFWVGTNLYEGEDLEGEEISILCAVGEVPDLFSVAHWVGLKMAHEQLTKSGAV